MSLAGYTELVKTMIVINKLHKRAFDNVVTDAGINRTQHFILAQLSKKGCLGSQKEIAEMLGITPAAVTLALAKLEKDSLITRAAGEDSRFNTISITPKGKEILDATHEQFYGIDSLMFKNFSNDELSEIELLFGKMKEKISEYINGEQK